MSRQSSDAALVDHDVDVFDEIRRRRAAMASDPVEVARLNRLDDRSKIGRPNVVNSVRVDDSPISEDLKEHSKLAAVVRAPKSQPRQQRICGCQPPD